MGTPADSVDDIAVEIVEQREYPRIPLPELRLKTGPFEFAGNGDLSLGGARWSGDAWAIDASSVEVSFDLPNEPTFYVRGDVVGVKEGEETSVHVRFPQLPFEVERAIARHTDNWMRSLQRDWDIDIDVAE